MHTPQDDPAAAIKLSDGGDMSTHQPVILVTEGAISKETSIHPGNISPTDVSETEGASREIIPPLPDNGLQGVPETEGVHSEFTHSHNTRNSGTSFRYNTARMKTTCRVYINASNQRIIEEQEPLEIAEDITSTYSVSLIRKAKLIHTDANPTVGQARKSPHWSNWKSAINAELQQN